MKTPAFQFYVHDFIVGTMHFSAEETGAYIRLLCYQWDNGFIEADDKKLKKITGISAKNLKKVLEKFSRRDDGSYKNMRLEKERLKQEELREARSVAGKKGNETKWHSSQGDRKPIAKRSQTPSQNVALQSSSSSSSSEEQPIQDAPLIFDTNNNTRMAPTKQAVWEAFQRNGGTVEMAKAFYERNEAVGWMLRGSEIKNFASLVPSYIRAWLENRPEELAPVKRMVM